jgi:hypothetical protein
MAPPILGRRRSRKPVAGLLPQRFGPDLVAVFIHPVKGGLDPASAQATLAVLHAKIIAYHLVLVARVRSFWSLWFDFFPFSISSDVRSILAS